MYERFLEDPGSVDTAWHEFFADYSPDKSESSRPTGDQRTVLPLGGDGTAAPAPAPAADTEASATAAPPKTTPTHNGAAATQTPTAGAPGTSQAATSTPAASTPTTAAARTGTAQPRAASGGTASDGSASDAASDAAASGGSAGARAEARRSDDKPAPAKSGGQAAPDGQQSQPLRGAAARVVANMETSLTVPTATSVRAVPAKLLIDNRIVINNHLRRARGGKVSFTHLIGFAMVRALRDHPEMNNSFAEVDGRPALVIPEHVNLGLAIDLQAKNGSRSLVVASVKGADTMDFSQFLSAYEDIIRRARQGKLTADDFAGTTISLTNPGTIGTEHSVPRLMQGQGTIIGVGAMEYPAAFAGMSEEALAQSAVSRTVTLTSTYDHRIIQGAQSGEFLKRMHELLLGGDGFYDGIFRALHIPYEPVRWVQDQTFSHEGQIDKA
ncbi:MAG TPA: 2-oxo acid dehydrogenase subunit E2, partial [Mycobacteriales bacterium]|nr:2-oxo acid dehydrogenase subunit E2 [Mycobacteriales bacterium]